MYDLDVIYYDEYNDMMNTYMISYKKGNIIPYYSSKFNSEISSYRNLLLLKTSLSLNDIIDVLIKKFEMDILKDTLYKEMYIYLCSMLYGVCFKVSAEDINKRYNHSIINTNSSIRLELYRNGWKPSQIEKYMSRYILKTNLDIHVNEELYNILMSNICLLLNVTDKNATRKIGRPPLPLIVKEIVKKNHKDKIRENMRKKYSYSEQYEKLKDSLLTAEELNIINNSNLPSNIKNKLYKLTEIS